MNNGRTLFRVLAFELLGFASLAFVVTAGAQTAVPPPAPGQVPFGRGKHFPAGRAPAAPVKQAASGEEFFIVASIDLQKSQILLKHPTEVTLLAKVDPSTKFADENGKPLKLSDFRAGDTVWVTIAGGASGSSAVALRKGEMTVAELHRYYLDYPEIK